MKKTWNSIRNIVQAKVTEDSYPLWYKGGKSKQK